MRAMGECGIQINELEVSVLERDNEGRERGWGMRGMEMRRNTGMEVH